ncbi:MAG TPA: hypothetical protein VGD65_11070 [Chryseosolibacter sp.]
MTKNALIVLLLFYQPLYAQDFANALQERLDQYYQSFQPLKVHVFLNQPVYAAGDTVFYKIDLVTAQHLRPVPGKSILNVAVLNDSNDTVITQQFSIYNGRGFNQLVLPSNLPEGNYAFSVWNKWMTESNTVLYKKPFHIGHSRRAIPKLEARPEGGNLVDKIPTRIVIAGKSSASGLIRENGRAISQFTLSIDGTATIPIVPKTQHRYTIELDGQVVALPEVETDGVVMNAVALSHTQSLQVALHIPENSRYIRTPLKMIASCQGIIYRGSEITFKTSSSITFDIPLEGFPDGVIQLTLFDLNGNVITERLIANLSPLAITSHVVLPKSIFHTREKVDLELKVMDNGSPVKANFALTVFHDQLTPSDSASSHDLATDLIFSGDCTHAGPHLSTSTHPREIDNRMILSTWTRFNWKNLGRRSDNAFYSQYMEFEGSAVDAGTGKPVPDSTKITFFLQKNANTYQAYTRDGNFTVTMLFDFFGTDEVFFRAEFQNQLRPDVRVTIPPTIGNFAQSRASLMNQSPYSDLFLKRKTVGEAYSASLPSVNKYKNASPAQLEDEVFGADVTIRLSDYQLFPTMVETLREIIPFTHHRITRGKNTIRVYDRQAEIFRSVDPVYVIDGIMIDDTDYFLSLNPSEIISIKIIHSSDKLNAFGSIGKGGLIIVETKIPNNALNVPRGINSFKLAGLTAPIVRRQVLHSIHTLRIPDLRTNLHWMPEGATDANGNASISFFTSDAPGVYKILGEGITNDGKPFTFEKHFEVTFDNASTEKH